MKVKAGGRRQQPAEWRADACAASVIMPTTSWTGPFEVCARRVLDQIEASPRAVEFIVVHDGPMPKPPAWLRRPAVTVLEARVRSGPAAARNKAAKQARGAILFFVDSDVELAADALERVCRGLGPDDGPVAMFGTYDDAPAGSGVVSQYRNLLHHHTHVTHPGRSTTFWAGCGAVRAAHFADLGGFDERYGCPSIEDIELGMRISAHGGEIVLDPLLRGKHHKVWTLRSMVATDIACRAVPWTKLIVKTGRLPATLNIDWNNRISGILAVASVTAAVWAALTGSGVLVATACGAMVVALNRDFYLLCLKRRGPIFAAACVALHFLYFIYASVAFGVVVLSAFVRRGWSAAPPCPTEAASPATGVGEESPAYGATASPPVV
jgi:hypothetical protein